MNSGTFRVRDTTSEIFMSSSWCINLDILVANGIDVADFVAFPHDNCDYSVIDEMACEPFDE